MVERRNRVLVVDHCKDTVHVLGALLELLGHEARGVCTGCEALATAAIYQPDVVLLDLVLPDMSGFDVATALRARSARELYLAALTGRNSALDRARSREAGIDRHVLKPIRCGQLCELLSEATRFN